MRTLDVVVAILLVVGGLNWGLVGLFNFDLVETLFASIPAVQQAVYVLVGLSAVYQIIGLKGIQTRWIYLEPIFIRGALRKEKAIFDHVDAFFCKTMAKIRDDPKQIHLIDWYESDICEMKDILKSFYRA